MILYFAAIDILIAVIDILIAVIDITIAVKLYYICCYSMVPFLLIVLARIMFLMLLYVL